MCGRFTLTTPDLKLVAETAQAAFNPVDAMQYRRRYNIAPTQRHWIVGKSTNTRSISPAIWGWTLQTGLLINLRIETLIEREHYQKQLRNNQCLVPTDSFYEWGGEKGIRIPYRFHAPDYSMMFFAGIYWIKENQRYFSILTQEAEAPVASIHERMPVFVPKSSFELWWSAPELFLRAIPKTALLSYRVSTRVNNIANDDAECLLPDHKDEPVNPQLGMF